MTASLRGRFCAHGVPGEGYCEDCHLEMTETCAHKWHSVGFSPDFGPIYECGICLAVAP